MPGDATLQMLTGVHPTPEMPYGENMTGPDLTDGYSQGERILFVPATALGNGVQGPPQEQLLEIWRDDRPLAVDQLGMQGPWVIPWTKVSYPSEGKTFTLNLNYGSRFDKRLPGLQAEQEPGGLQSPYPAVTVAQGPTAIEFNQDGEAIYLTQAGAP